jgi:hypothetical protein
VHFNGNVGIGTTTPSKLLDVNGAANFNGIVTMPNQPAFHAFCNTNEATAAYSPAPFTGVVFNNGNNYSTANRRFTAPVSGYYQFNHVVNANGSSAQYSAAFFKNNTIASAWQFSTPSGSSWILVSGSSIIYMVAGDFVDVRASTQQHWDYGNVAWGEFSGFLIG